MKKNIPWILIFGLFSFLITFPHSPLFLSVVNIDQAVYQYIGNRILDGQIPYLNAWDHKQPLIYFIYALGSLITGRTLWGIWLIEFVCLWVTGVLSFFLLTKFCPKILSLFFIFVSLFTICNLLGISNPEQLALPFYIFSLLLFNKLVNRETNLRQARFISFLIGISFACCFYLKQSLISIPIAISLYYFFHIIVNKKWKLLINFLFIAIGFLLITSIFFVYFLINHALSDYWNGAFVFNFIYSHTGLLEKINSILDQMEIIATIPPFITGFGLWLCLLIVFFVSQLPRIIQIIRLRFFSFFCISGSILIVLFIFLKRFVERDSSFGVLKISGLVIALFLLIIGIIKKDAKFSLFVGRIETLPIIKQLRERVALYYGFVEITVLLFPLILFFISLSGEHYDYYNTTLYPVVILSFGIFVSLIVKEQEESLYRVILTGAIIGISIAFVYNPVLSLVLQYKKTPDPQYLSAIDYIKKTTNPNDFIYVWGIETSIYNSAGRESPTRYFYQLAAVNWEPFAKRFSVIEEITATLEKENPQLFIVTDGIDLGKTETDCINAITKSGNNYPILNLVCTNYSYDKSFGNIQMYRLKTN